MSKPAIFLAMTRVSPNLYSRPGMRAKEHAGGTLPRAQNFSGIGRQILPIVEQAYATLKSRN
jgi:hypothetical protein